MRTLTLRSRITLILMFIVTVTSSLSAVGVLLLKAKLEEVIFADMVQTQLQSLIMQLDSGGFDPERLSVNWRFYHGGTSGSPPDTFSGLDAGSHHSVRVDGQYYQVEVDEWRDQPVYLSYDITEWEEQEHQLLEWLAYGVGLLILVTLLMGWQASRAILAPVQALSARLNEIHAGERNVRISSEFQGNELSPIAAAFDRYLRRMDQFVERERSFTAAASHELRTPLSVMMGALDVLETRESDPATTRALNRIRRACAEMRAFVEATLFLSREEASTIEQHEPVRLNELVQDLLEDNAVLISEQDIHVELGGETSVTLEQPPSLVKICISNILRNAFEHSPHGRVSITLHPRHVTIRDNGEGIRSGDLSRVFDRDYSTKSDGFGMGLNLVRRICDRFDWNIDIESQPGTGTTVTLSFD